MTARIAGHAAGKMRGAADAVLQRDDHAIRAWDTEHRDAEREAAARGRWEAGLPARNTYERDAYTELEHQVRAGRNTLDRVAEEAAAVEAAREAAASEAEAGS